jgi:rod shape determining protein RodA
MFRKYLSYLKRSDWLLSMVAFFLTAFGIVAIYGIEAAGEQPQFTNLKKQIIFFAVGLFLLVIFTALDYRFLKSYGTVLFLAGCAILGVLLILGTAVRGTKGWLFIFGSQGFQPVEIIKIVLIIFVSKLFAQWRTEVVTLKRFGIICGCAFALVLLVLLQPDLGSAFILSLIFVGMLLLARVKKTYLVGLFVILVAVIVASWFLILHDYQKERVLNFLDPSRDPYGTGYNIKQSIITVGSGTLFGRGLALGSQSRLNFLPAQETDFIFAVIAEELGFVGAMLLLVFCVVMAYRLVKIARQARDDFGVFVVIGITIYFVGQGVMNIAMNIGLLPIAGVPLPFVSYGGSSLLASFIAIGIVQSIHIRQIEKTVYRG